jgi:hypothetical protein
MISTFRTAATLATAVSALLILAAPANAQGDADGAAANSPGTGDGAGGCGNTVGVIALLNPTFGNTCANT